MRIISGKYRRRKLQANPGQTTRPITDRAKEALFANIEHRFSAADVKVADIFSGTGSLGLESLSRGAVAATFFERDRKAVQLLRENIAHVGVEDDTLVWPTDILRCSFKPKHAEFAVPWNIVFLDPPYIMVRDLKPKTPFWKMIERLAKSPSVADDALLIFRTPKRDEFDFPTVWRREEPLYVTNMCMHLFTKPPGTTVFPETTTSEATISDAPAGDTSPGHESL